MPDACPRILTASPPSTCAVSPVDGCADTTWWLEEKSRRAWFVSKTRHPVSSPVAQRLGAQTVGGVGYSRHAYEHGRLRVTVDRDVVTADGRPLGWVVVEVKGRQPRWLRSLLGKPRRDFSKRRFVTRKVDP